MSCALAFNVAISFFKVANSPEQVEEKTRRKLRAEHWGRCNAWCANGVPFLRLWLKMRSASWPQEVHILWTCLENGKIMKNTWYRIQAIPTFHAQKQLTEFHRLLFLPGIVIASDGWLWSCLSTSFFPKFRRANRQPLGCESPQRVPLKAFAPETMVAMLANAVSAVYVMTEKTVLEPEISGRPNTTQDIATYWNDWNSFNVAKPSKGESHSVFQSSAWHGLPPPLNLFLQLLTQPGKDMSRKMEKPCSSMKSKENSQVGEMFWMLGLQAKDHAKSVLHGDFRNHVHFLKACFFLIDSVWFRARAPLLRGVRFLLQELQLCFGLSYRPNQPAKWSRNIHVSAENIILRIKQLIETFLKHLLSSPAWNINAQSLQSTPSHLVQQQIFLLEFLQNGMQKVEALSRSFSTFLWCCHPRT